MRRTQAAAAAPRVIGRPGCDFISLSAPPAGPVFANNASAIVAGNVSTLAGEVGGLYGHGQAGSFLRERLFELGGRHDWERTVELATGQPIAVDAYVEEWFRG